MGEGNQIVRIYTDYIFHFSLSVSYPIRSYRYLSFSLPFSLPIHSQILLASLTGNINDHVIGKIFLNIAAVLLAGVAFGWVAQLIKGTFKVFTNQS